MVRRRLLIVLTFVAVGALSACGNPREQSRPTSVSSPEPRVSSTTTPAPNSVGMASPTTTGVPSDIAAIQTRAAVEQARADATATALAANAGIYRYDVPSRTLTKISDARAHVLAWLPSGDAIWYSTAWLPNGRGEIRRLDLNTGDDALVLAFSGGFVDLAPSAGRAVYGSFRTQQPDIGYTVHVFDQARGLIELGEGSHLSLSPDGSMVAFVTPSCGDAPKLKIIDLNRSAPITLPDIVPGWFDWIPDGRIAVRTGRTTQSSGQWVVIDPTTGASSRLLDLIGSEAFDYFSLAPDEKHAVLTVDGPNGRTTVRDVTTGKEVELPVWPPSGGQWAPDSSGVLVPTRGALLVASEDGTVTDTIKLPVSDESGYYAYAQWSPDASSIVFSVTEAGGFGVCD